MRRAPAFMPVRPSIRCLRSADGLPFEPPGGWQRLARWPTISVASGRRSDRLRPERRPTDGVRPWRLLLYVNRRVDGATPALTSIHDLVQADACAEAGNCARSLLISLRKSRVIDIAAGSRAAALTHSTHRRFTT